MECAGNSRISQRKPQVSSHILGSWLLFGFTRLAELGLGVPGGLFAAG